MTGGDAIRMYTERIQGRVDLKPLTKAYHSQRIGGLLKSWSALEKADLSKVTKTDCLDWAARFGPKVIRDQFRRIVWSEQRAHANRPIDGTDESHERTTCCFCHFMSNSQSFSDKHLEVFFRTGTLHAK